MTAGETTGSRAASADPGRGLSPTLGIVLVLVAATGFGLLPILLRGAYAGGLSPEAATFYRYGVPALVFVPLIVRFNGDFRAAAIAVATGLVLGFGVLGYFRALHDMPVAVAALIFFTFPLFAVVVGFLAFRLRPDRRSLAGALMVLIACTLFLDPTAIAARPMAVLHAFAAPAAYATGILVMAHVLSGADRLATLGGIYLGTAISSGLPLVAGAPGGLFPETPVGFAAALGLLTIGGIVPQVALVFAAPVIGPARTSIIAAFELVVALGSGWLVLGEPIRLVEVVSAALIVTAVVLAATARPAHVKSATA